MASEASNARGVAEAPALATPLGAAWTRHGARVGLALLFAGLALLLLAGLLRPVNAYDEGFALYGAARVLAGEVPYRDFWVVYAPGQFYALAALFRLLGESVLVERLWDTAARLAILALAYALTARLTTRGVAAVATLFLAVPLAVIDYYGYAVFPAVAASLLAVWCLTRHAASGRGVWLFAAGLAVGVSTLFRHDIGAYTIVPVSLAAFALSLAAASAPRRPWSLVRRVLLAQLTLAAGVLAVLLPLTLYLLLVVDPRVLWDSLVVYPLTLNRAISYLPYPPLVPASSPPLHDLARLGTWWADTADPWVRFYVPPLVCLAALAALIVHAIQRLAGSRQQGTANSAPMALGTVVGALALLGLLFFNHALNRFDRMHALPALVVAVILASVLLWQARCALRARPLAPLLGAGAAALAAVYVVAPLQTYWGHLNDFTPLVCHAPAARAGCVDLYADQEEAYAYIQAHTAPDERIFVGLHRHDQIYASDVIFYFMAGRHAATRYHELISGVATTRPVQEEIISGLEQHRVRYIVTTDNYADVHEPNASALSSGVTLLDDYLRAHYTVVARLGAYTIWHRP